MKRSLANLFQWLADFFSPKIRILHVPFPEVFNIPAGAADWLPAHAEALNAFLTIAPGKVLSERLRFIAATVAVNGARNTVNTIHAAGVSAGWDEAVRYLHSLSRVSRVEDTKTNDEQPTGESALLEQLSP